MNENLEENNILINMFLTFLWHSGRRGGYVTILAEGWERNMKE